MMRKQSGRKILAYLFLVLTFVMIAGCAGKKGSGASSTPGDTQKTAEQAEENLGKPVVTVLMDLPAQVDYSPDEFSKTFSAMPGYETDFMVRVESLPRMGTERDTAISRLRTEMLAGKGPDLFLCAQRLYGADAGPENMPFFQFPVQAMKNHLLLPLDDYIENAEYMDWDQLQPVVMDAGRNDEGQQIIPLTYTFAVTFFDGDYPLASQFPMTWEEMTEDPDPNIRMSAYSTYLQDVIGDIADYSKDAPAFSEDELRTWAAKHFGAWESIREDMQEEEWLRSCYLDRQMLSWCEIDLNGDQAYTIIPCYNLDGGVTANITTFAAVNRNARRPEEAFKVIDYLMKPGVQQTSLLFQNRMQGIPVYMNTGDENTVASSWCMTEDNFRQISAIEEQINIAKFPGPLDVCLWGVEAYNEDVLKKSCHEQYVLMQMYLGES